LGSQLEHLLDKDGKQASDDNLRALLDISIRLKSFYTGWRRRRVVVSGCRFLNSTLYASDIGIASKSRTTTMREEKATSLREIEDLVQSVFASNTTCFRGQSCASWDLVPSAYRPLIPFLHNPDFDLSWPDKLERDTYRDFEIEARKILGKSFEPLERLSVAQHHGVPTRLLDWTSDLAIAAYFSVFGGDHGDCAIWCLNLSRFPFPKGLGRQHRGGGFRLANINKYGRGKFPSFAQPVSEPISVFGTGNSAAAVSGSPKSTFIVWIPQRVHDRLDRQKCLLSWYHSFEECDLVWNYSTHIKELEGSSGQELLCKIVITSKDRFRLREEILKRGLNEYELFPDLDGLGKCLARKHHQLMASGLFVK
jgi:FRG domain